VKTRPRRGWPRSSDTSAFSRRAVEMHSARTPLASARRSSASHKRWMWCRWIDTCTTRKLVRPASTSAIIASRTAAYAFARRSRPTSCVTRKTTCTGSRRSWNGRVPCAPRAGPGSDRLRPAPFRRPPWPFGLQPARRGAAAAPGSPSCFGRVGRGRGFAPSFTTVAMLIPLIFHRRQRWQGGIAARRSFFRRRRPGRVSDAEVDSARRRSGPAEPSQPRGGRSWRRLPGRVSRAVLDCRGAAG
jgi:hypothetical protein